MAENRFKYKITADDETAKGVKSAEKGLGKLTGATKRYEGAVSASRRANASVPYRGAVDQLRQATGRLASTVPSVSRYGSVIKDVGSAAASAANGVKAASEAGSGLSSVLGGIIGLGAGAVGVLASIAAGGVAITSGWVKSTATLYRMSQATGVAFDDLQKLQAAGEHVGIDKGTLVEGVASVGSTMHQAAYGGNNEALASASYLGLRMNKTADGAADIKDFLLQLSDQVAKQKEPYTQAHIAQIFGASALLPLLREGRAAVQNRIQDAGVHAAVVGKSDGELSVREYSKGVDVAQATERGVTFGEAGAARAGEGVLDAARARARALADGGGSGLAAKTGGVIANVAVAGLGSASRFASGQVEHLGGVIEQTIRGINRGTLGGRLNNPGNVRPVGGNGFAHYRSDAEGLSAMGHQLLRDQLIYGARTPYDILAGARGPNGKRRMGYAPAQDHNDPRSYADEVGRAIGGRADDQIDLTDPKVLAAVMAAMIKKETNSVVPSSSLLPIAQSAERRIVLEIHGLPRGSHVKATKASGATIAVGRAMTGDGP